MARLDRFAKSARLLRRSQLYLAGGVSSMLRASSRPLPLFFSSAQGSQLVDVDGNRYIDYGLGWGPLILGHSHPAVLKAVSRQLRRFQHLGGQHDLECKVAQKICRIVRCAELVAFSNTGSEAVQVALRLARAFTERPKFIKFEGHYHGWIDNVLVSYQPKGSPREGYEGVPSSAGQSRSALAEVFVLPWNDLATVEKTLEAHHSDIAAIITEPVLCNSSCLLPEPGYLEGLRDLATKHDVVLIFDEVITGFRVHLGGAQKLFGVTPDLAVFGKAVAAGFPLSVIAGKKEIMELIPQKRVVHAGTFNGNPVSLAAADAALAILLAHRGGVLMKVRKLGERLIQGLQATAAKTGVPVLINGVGSAFHVSFTSRAGMRNYQETLDCDLAARDCFIESMVNSGIYLLPDGRWYVSAAHTEADIEKALVTAERAFRKVQTQSTPIAS